MLLHWVLVASQLKQPESGLTVPEFEQLAEIGGMAPQTIRDAFKQMLAYFRKVRVLSCTLISDCK